jgi:F-type H+-transporting ATPase subunit b
MSIDWFTFAAQVINLLLLIWLLKRFLYRPILAAIAAREKRITEELAQAKARQAEADQQRDEFRHKVDEIDQRKAALLTEATQKAQAEYQRLLEEARKSADELGHKRLKTLHEKIDRLNQSLAQRVQQEVFAIARKTLAELASVSLEAQMTAALLQRLQALDAKQKSRMQAALASHPSTPVVRSAFELPAAQREAIQNTLNDIMAGDIQLRFETEPDLLSGIELTASGYKLAWSISDYLDSVEKGVGELLQKEEESPQEMAPAGSSDEAGR